MNKSTINKAEIDKFSKIADEWWDPNGKFKPIHKFNPLRIEYIKKSNISYLNIGKTNGKKIKIDRDKVIDIEELRDLYENWFKSYLKSN